MEVGPFQEIVPIEVVAANANDVTSVVSVFASRGIQCPTELHDHDIFGRRNKNFSFERGIEDSDATLKTLLISRFPASNFVNPSKNVLPRLGDCRTHEPYATNVKPPGFP